ncbi:single-stranded-DNA-specific exonuclease RecJ [soil metagenome]
MLAAPIQSKRWTFRETDEEAVIALQQQLRIHPVLCRLMVQRGIFNINQAKAFFRPNLADLHDPFLMKDMIHAVERIERAIRDSEKILIYGDYDVDGTTAVALTYTFFKDFYERLEFYIPDRYAEGYGVSKMGVDYAIANGFKLIIALDCGIKSVDKVAYALEHGVDFIICDHHLPGTELPPAAAVLDPKRNDCEYPYKELSGCGIGFKLAQAFAKRNGIPDEVVFALLDLVVVSIASDIVPITGENRVLSYFGLELINKGPKRRGIASLLKQAGIDKELNITDLVFIIGPRINAAGRMGHAKAAVELLISDTEGSSTEGAEELQNRNANRKEVDKEITGDALQLILEDPSHFGRTTTVVMQEHWHKGVIGIVASRLMEHYYRPTIVFTLSNGKVTGSARSVRDFDVHEALLQCSDLLEQFGGHKYAAGLTLLPENLPAFRQRFEEVVSATIHPDLLIPEVSIDAEIDLHDVNDRFYNILKQFAPFGPENMRPVFISKGVYDGGGTRVVKEQHLKLHVTQDGKHHAKGIGFNMGYFGDQVVRKGSALRKFDLCFCLEPNEWQGQITIELSAKDIRMV